VVEGLDYTEGVDITDRTACDAAVERIIQNHGRIDVLCNNAGVSAVGDAVLATPDDWERVFAVNVFGAAYLTAAVLPYMRSAGSGVIVNTCSVVATLGLMDRVVYSASKGALLAMTRAIAADEITRGIRVNAVSPATVDGAWVRRNAEESADPAAFMQAMRDRQPTRQMISSSAVAQAVAFLADPTVNLTGVNLVVDGGITSLRP
jgi:NAD(P)-dependent dehydrogenase (short-subunit alcohol dehydrogenase family)